MSSNVFSPGESYSARIQQVEQTPSGVVLVWLHVIDDFDHLHRPGQYLQMKLGDEWSFFSIASLPCIKSPLELHIQTNHDDKVRFLLDAFADQRIIEVKYPFGVATWKPSLTEGLFLARGTGFAPVKAFIDAALDRNTSRRIHLCWEGESGKDLYFLPWLTKRLADHPSFSVTLYATGVNEHLIDSQDRLEHKFGSISDDLAAPENSSIPVNPDKTWCYLCASPVKVYQWVDELLLNQVLLGHMSSDVFEYAPR